MSALQPAASRPMSSRNSDLAPTDRRRVENVGRRDRGNVSRADPREDRGPAHLLEDVVRRHIGADAHIDAGLAVLAEMLQHLAIAGER